MTTVHLLTFTPDLELRERVIAWADKSPLVVDWRTDTVYSIYLASNSPTVDLSTDFEAAIKPTSPYLFVEIRGATVGAQAVETWEFFNRAGVRGEVYTTSDGRTIERHENETLRNALLRSSASLSQTTTASAPQEKSHA